MIVSPTGAAGPTNHRTRASVMSTVTELLKAAPGPVLVGWDFGFGYPRGFCRALDLEGWEGIWAMLADRVTDDAANANNRLTVAADLNDRFEGPGPFWGNVRHPAATHPVDRLPARAAGIRYGTPALPFAERRLTEMVLPAAQPMFKMAYAGSVGSQSMVGIAQLQGLRTALGPRMAVWPFQPLDASPGAVVVAEVYPTMFTPADPHPNVGVAGRILDANQVLYTADALAGLPETAFDTGWMPTWVRQEEGWILGAPRPT